MAQDGWNRQLLWASENCSIRWVLPRRAWVTECEFSLCQARSCCGWSLPVSVLHRRVSELHACCRDRRVSIAGSQTSRRRVHAAALEFWLGFLLQHDVVQELRASATLADRFGRAGEAHSSCAEAQVLVTCWAGVVTGEPAAGLFLVFNVQIAALLHLCVLNCISIVERILIYVTDTGLLLLIDPQSLFSLPCLYLVWDYMWWLPCHGKTKVKFPTELYCFDCVHGL